MKTLNVELTNIYAWLEADHLSLNSDMTSYLKFHRRKQVAQDIASFLSMVMPSDRQMMQNRILRAICNAGFRASADLIYQRLKLLKLEEIYRYIVGAYVFKTLNIDRPCVFEYIDETNHVIRESVLNFC